MGKSKNIIEVDLPKDVFVYDLYTGHILGYGEYQEAIEVVCRWMQMTEEEYEPDIDMLSYIKTLLNSQL
jgi:hypothetical protein